MQNSINEDAMVLKVWGEEWGLPSIDPHCLAVIAYAKLSGAPIKTVPCLPKKTITGILPELETSGFIYSDFFSIIGIFRREGFNSDYQLTDSNQADTFAFLSYLEQKLKPAVIYALWGDEANYMKVTRPAYGKLCGFPWSLIYPRRLRQNRHNYLIQASGLPGKHLRELEKSINLNAIDCMNLLERKLGKKNFLFGDSPSMIDAAMYGYLAILLRAPLVSTELKNHLHACTSLRSHCYRMDSRVSGNTSYSDSTTNRDGTSLPVSKEPWFKRDQLLTFGAVIACMVLYAYTSGVLTTRRSRLAVQLGTVRNLDVKNLAQD